MKQAPPGQLVSASSPASGATLFLCDEPGLLPPIGVRHLDARASCLEPFQTRAVETNPRVGLVARAESNSMPPKRQIESVELRCLRFRCAAPFRGHLVAALTVCRIRSSRLIEHTVDGVRSCLNANLHRRTCRRAYVGRHWCGCQHKAAGWRRRNCIGAGAVDVIEVRPTGADVPVKRQGNHLRRSIANGTIPDTTLSPWKTEFATGATGRGAACSAGDWPRHRL
jgi:hypothetical protein